MPSNCYTIMTEGTVEYVNTETYSTIPSDIIVKDFSQNPLYRCRTKLGRNLVNTTFIDRSCLSSIILQWNYHKVRNKYIKIKLLYKFDSHTSLKKLLKTYLCGRKKITNILFILTKLHRFHKIPERV